MQTYTVVYKIQWLPKHNTTLRALGVSHMYNKDGLIFISMEFAFMIDHNLTVSFTDIVINWLDLLLKVVMLY